MKKWSFCKRIDHQKDFLWANLSWKRFLRTDWPRTGPCCEQTDHEQDFVWADWPRTGLCVSRLTTNMTDLAVSRLTTNRTFCEQTDHEQDFVWADWPETGLCCEQKLWPRKGNVTLHSVHNSQTHSIGYATCLLYVIVYTAGYPMPVKPSKIWITW